MTDLPDVPVGATWRCADFHLHTPGVHSFVLPPGTDVNKAADRERLAGEYVRRLADAGISVAAITDYQGVRQPWFTLIRDGAKAVGITVLPGAEMSIRGGGGKGIHLLLICSPDTELPRIAQVICHQGESPDPLYPGEARSKHKDLDLKGSTKDALKHIRDQLGCAVIAAHAKSSSGVIKVLGAQLTAELIRDGLIDAIDQCESAIESLRSTGVLTKEQLASLACTLSSDSHNLGEIGTKELSAGRRRLTWIKLSVVNADALRLALHDPQTRVLTRPPEPVRHSRILAMEVTGGFLDGLRLRFSDDLTTLIGGRGAGKSAILETLRYALGGEAYSDQSERMSLVGHALGSGGRVRVIIERPGPSQQQCYEIARVLNQRPRVTDLAAGTVVDVPPLELFGEGGTPVILLQREIQAVARDDDFRRRLLDEIIGIRARQADAAVRRTLEELRRNGAAIEELERQLDRRDEYTERLNRLTAEITYYEQQGVAEKLERHSKISSDEARLETALTLISDAFGAHLDGADAVADALDAADAELNEAESEQASTLRELSVDIVAVRQRVADAQKTVSEQLAPLRDRVGSAVRSWPSLTAGLEEDLRRIQQTLGVGQLDATRFMEAVRDRTALMPIIDGMSRNDETRSRLRKDRDALLRRLQDERHRGFELRQQAAATVNNVLADRLRMDVDYLGDAEDFGSRLSAVLKGSGVTADAIGAIGREPGTDGVEIARTVAQGETEVVKQFGITTAMAHRLVAWLTDPGRIRQFEILAPSDRVAIALDVDGSPRDLAELSSGQKATALLLLLFAQSGRPLILDQPEDDLDNRFVYEDVVTLLRAEKGTTDPARRRQIIAATHNANIPVNGDAELVLSLADEGGRCQVRTRASIDDAEVRGEIRTVLEGGAEAFRRRAEKYGGLDDTR
ncbi:MAG TPA: AAA family ATPase [Streptosporangiaceae bacterium]